ncbi:MAG: hypothetical protein ACP5EP_11365, partial [Acidobacteriaceae bacterium]
MSSFCLVCLALTLGVFTLFFRSRSFPTQAKRRPAWVTLPSLLLLALFALLALPLVQAQTVTFSGYQMTVPTTRLESPNGVAVDSKGDVYIADTNNNRVVEEPWDSSTSGYGTQTTVGTGLSGPAGVAVDSKGDVLIADTGKGTAVEVATQSVNLGAVAVGSAAT